VSELPEDLANAVRAIEEDRIHGALELAAKAVETVERALDRPRVFEALNAALSRARPTLAPIAGAAAFCFGGKDVGKRIREARRLIREGSVQAAGKLVERVGKGKRVLTLSRSSAVEAALKALEPSWVLVLESRPGGEGLRVAADLAGRGIQVEVVVDSQVGRAAQASDLALMGVDAEYPDGSVVNKCGSLPMALAANLAGIPVFALSHPFKKVARVETDLESGDPRVAVPGSPPGVRVENTPFEVVPGHLIEIVSTGC